MKSLKIKFIKACSILFITGGVIISCSEDFLQPKPLSMFMPENTYTNKTAMISLLNDCRFILRDEFVDNFSQLNTELCWSDYGVYGEPTNSAPKNYDVQITPSEDCNFAILDITSENISYWNLGFQAIKSANVVISRHDKASYNTEADKNEILAEGYFHRAYWYYRIVHQFGDVPFIDGEITRPTVDMYSMSRKSILNRMITDMEFAVKWLPVSVQFGEVSRAAGYHLLTKLYLSMGRFDDAISAATEVIEKSGLALMKNRFGTKINPTYEGVTYEGSLLLDLFRKENISLTENTEGILISQDRVGFRGGKGASTEGSCKMRNYGPGWTYLPGIIRSGHQHEYLGRGVGFSCPSPYNHYTIWKGCGEDLRHKWPNWFPIDSLKYNDPAQANFHKYYPKPNIPDTIRTWFSHQYYKIFVPDETHAYNDPRGGYTDVYVFRLAETYLLRAEAYWWTNKMDKARDDINAIRGRVNAPLIATSDVTIDYILDERVRELYTEEPRKTELTRIAFIMADQKRDGFSTDNMHQKNFFYDRVMRCNEYFGKQVQVPTGQWKMSAYHYLWPIPQTNIDANVEGHINQNMGYAGCENNIKPLE